MMTDECQQQTSRSGRVLKRNPHLADYESSDPSDTPAKRKSAKRGAIKNNADEKLSEYQVQGKTIGKPQPSRTLQQFLIPPPPLQNSSSIDEPVTNFDLLDELGGPDFNADDFGETIPDEIEGLLGINDIIPQHETNNAKNYTVPNKNSSGTKLKSQAQSIYMLEKQLEVSKRKTNNSLGSSAFTSNVFTTGRSPTKKEPTSGVTKPKNNTKRVTGYTAWAKDYRATNPEYLNSREMSKLWTTLSQTTKNMWKKLALRQTKTSGENIKNTTPLPPPPKINPNPRRRVTKMKNTSNLEPNNSHLNQPIGGPKKKKSFSETLLELNNSPIYAPPPKKIKYEKIKPAKSGKKKKGKNGSSTSTKSPKNGGKKSHLSPSAHFSTLSNKRLSVTPNKALVSGNSGKVVGSQEPVYKVTGTAPDDVAAHLILLSESLTAIGHRLTEEKMESTSGSLSVLLDSLLVGMSSLMCLTRQVDEINVIPASTLRKTLDNIAYVIPGL